MKTATLFSGGEGVGVGLCAAGHDHVWGIEYDDKIADVARANGFHVVTADILDCDPGDFDRPDWLHASPPCPNFSNAKTGAEETDHDRALAAKVSDFIATILPRIFTLENVYQYRNSQSWSTIAKTLVTHGYTFNYWHVCMADYGVPQTRHRMIVIARKDGITPMLPPATHAENPVNGLFGKLDKWVGWHEAIEDLIPTLPDSEFAQWQLERLPPEYGNLLLEKDRGDYSINHKAQNEAAQSVTTSDLSRRRRAFILPGANASSFSVRNEDTPARVVGDVNRVGNIARAFIVQAANSQSNGGVVDVQDKPARTVDTSGKPVAFITSDQRSETKKGMIPVNKACDEPVTTIRAKSNGGIQSAFTSGRVVKMTPRALARFQSFPNSYVLPESNSLASRIIGNAVPPLFMQRLGEWLK